MPLPQRYLPALEAICETLVPDAVGDPQNATVNSATTDAIAQVYDNFSKVEKNQFDLFLRHFQLPVLGLIFTGAFGRIDQLSSEKREKWLHKLSDSSIPAFRQGFQAVKKLTTFIYYGNSPDGHTHPDWGKIGYPGPISKPPKNEKPFPQLVLKDGQEISCEVAIIGSGAGGGVVAAELAKAGKEVLVIEKGGYYHEGDFTQEEAKMVGMLYEKGGNLTSVDGGTTVFAGSCMGGGTTVNWAGTFRTPQYILEEWAREHQLPELLSRTFSQALDSTLATIHTNTDIVKHNPQNQKLWEGSKALKQKVGLVPQNIPNAQLEDLKGMGYAGLGDQYGAKQGTLVNQLVTAHQHGARFLSNTNCNRLHLNGNTAESIEVTQKIDGNSVIAKVKAKTIILAAGAIHTPAILMRSGFSHPEIGQHLYLHPTISVSGVYDEPIDPWHGLMMSAVNDHFTQIFGNYGFKLETPPAHPGLIGLSIPWQSAQQHREMMMQARNIASFIVLARDKNGGNIRLDKEGNPQIHYWPGKQEMQILKKGMEEAVNIHLAAGTTEALIPHNQLPKIRKEDGQHVGELIEGLPWEANRFPLFSAHQMGTCRMGGQANSHPVDPSGLLRGTKNLYVADASIFPASSGANPMLTIQALAWWVSQGLK